MQSKAASDGARASGEPARSPDDDLTREQALAEAVRRWGPGAYVEYRPPRHGGEFPGRSARYRCKVGNGALHLPRLEGQGDTWRRAFADVRSRS